MSTHPNRRPRRYELDPHPDAVCPLPAWMVETIDRARALGLHPSQRDAIEWVLGTVEADDLPAPWLYYSEKDAGGVLLLQWHSADWSTEVELRRTGIGWETRLGLWHNGKLIARETPRHPGHYLRTMLGRAFPGVGRSGRGRERG